MRNGSVKLVRLDVVVLKSRDVSSFFWIAFDPPVLPNSQPAIPGAILGGEGSANKFGDGRGLRGFAQASVLSPLRHVATKRHVVT